MPIAAFAEVRIDDNLIVYRTTGGSTFNTNVVMVNSGDEARNVTWAYPLGRWELGQREMVPADFEAFNNFFNARHGRAQAFRFKNWADFKDKGSGVLTAIAGSATTFQMFKNYTSGSVTTARQIAKPIAGIQVFRNGNPDAGATVALATGIVTPTLATGTLTWTGEFDTPVRFDSDQIQYEFIAAHVGVGGAVNVTDTFFLLHSVPVVEVRMR